MRIPGPVLGAVALLAAGQVPAAAQALRGSVVTRDSTPAAGVIVVGVDQRGRTVVRALTDSRGEFSVQLPSPGRVDIRVLRIGYRPTVGPSIDVAANETETVRLMVGTEAVTLTAVNVRDRETCRVGADTGLLVARAWEEARKAMLSTQLSAGGATLFAEWVEYDRVLDSTARLVRDQRVRTSRNPTTHAFRSQPAELLSERGYVVTDSGATTFYAPDAEVLLSDIFAAGHCFRLEEAPAGREHLIGVSFSPTRERRERLDIEGTLWLDRTSSELRLLEFRYTNLPDQARSVGGGEVEFLKLIDGDWLVSRWKVRMPQLTARRIASFGRRVTLSGTQVVLRGIQETGGEVTRLSRGDSLLYVLMGSEIVVQVLGRDTLVRADQAVLSLEGTDYAATATASGRIELAPVLPGRYRARIRTALMDSLGMPPVEQDVEARPEAQIEMVTLPAARVLVDIEVRDVSGTPLSQTTLETRPLNGALVRTILTGANGRASLRDLPQGSVEVQARRIGYLPGQVSTSIGPGRNLIPIVLSQVAAPELDTVRVRAVGQLPSRLQEFETRRLHHRATVSITRDDILKRNPTDTWQMLTTVPFMWVSDNGNAVVARSIRTKMPNASGLPCDLLVAVDGTLLNATPDRKAFDLRQLPRPDEIHGIEIFAGAASIPVQYGGEGDGKWCGLIAIWTR